MLKQGRDSIGTKLTSRCNIILKDYHNKTVQEQKFKDLFPLCVRHTKMSSRRKLLGNSYALKIIPSSCISEFLLLLLFFSQLLIQIFDFVSLQFQQSQRCLIVTLHRFIHTLMYVH